MERRQPTGTNVGNTTERDLVAAMGAAPSISRRSPGLGLMPGTLTLRRLFLGLDQFPSEPVCQISEFLVLLFFGMDYSSQPTNADNNGDCAMIGFGGSAHGDGNDENNGSTN